VAEGNILHFVANVPQEVALRFPDGKQVVGNYGPQYMFSLTEPADTRMYVPPLVAETIRDLGIGPGELFSVGKFERKNGVRKQIQWEVKRVDPAPAPAAREMPVAPAAARQQDTQTTASHPIRSQSGELAMPRVMPQSYKPNGNGHAAANGIPYFDPQTELLNCYDQAIDVLVSARDHAAAKGLPVQFTGEDLRQVAATLYIDAGKNRRTPWHPQAA
jgi:hypothetical protein